MVRTARRIVTIDLANLSIGARKGNAMEIRYKDGPLIFQTPYITAVTPVLLSNYGDIHYVNTIFSGDTEKKQIDFYTLMDNIEKKIMRLIKQGGAKKLGASGKISLKTLLKKHPHMDCDMISWPIVPKDGMIEASNPGQVNRKMVSPQYIAPNCLLKLIVECPYVWVKEQLCGVMITVKKVLVREGHVTDEEYAFDDDSDEYISVNDEIITHLANKTEVPDYRPTNEANEINARSSVEKEWDGGDTVTSDSSVDD